MIQVSTPEGGTPADPTVYPGVPHAAEAGGTGGTRGSTPGEDPGLVFRRINRRSGGGGPRIEVVVYKSDVAVKRKDPLPEGFTRPGGGKRGRIKGLSPASRRNLLHTARNIEGLVAMITLTYPREFPCDGRVVKGHWDNFRRWLARRGLGGMMFFEFQERGAPHMHVYVNGRVNRADVAQAWFRIVGSGDLRHLVAGTRVEAIRKPHAVAAYAAKYAAKQGQKEVPEGFASVGRFWSLFGGVRVPVKVTVEGPLEQELTEEEDGSVFEETPPMASLVRWVRKLRDKRRKERDLRKWRDNGLYSWTAYDIAPQVCGILGRMGLLEGEPA